MGVREICPDSKYSSPNNTILKSRPLNSHSAQAPSIYNSRIACLPASVRACHSLASRNIQHEIDAYSTTAPQSSRNIRIPRKSCVSPPNGTRANEHEHEHEHPNPTYPNVPCPEKERLVVEATPTLDSLTISENVALSVPLSLQTLPELKLILPETRQELEPPPGQRREQNRGESSGEGGDSSRVGLQTSTVQYIQKVRPKPHPPSSFPRPRTGYKAPLRL